MPVRRGNTWVARVRENGKDLFREVHRTKREALAAEQQFKADQLKGRARSALTCDVAVANWLTVFPRPKESTNRHNQERVKQFGIDFAGVRLDAVTRPDAVEWAKLHPRRAVVVRAMIQDFYNSGYVHQNVFSGLRVAQGRGRKNITPLTVEEVAELILVSKEMFPAPLGTTIAAMITTAAYVGCRPGELYALKWEDLEGEFLHIRRQFNSMNKLDLPKNHRMRKVVLAPQALEAIMKIPGGRDDFIFRTVRGATFQGSSFADRYWRPVRIAVGRPTLAFYELRHFCATYLLELGVSDFDVSIQLGHTDGGTLVRELYGHPSEDKARENVFAAFQRGYENNLSPIRKVTER